jgi:hypothetical protein
MPQILQEQYGRPSMAPGIYFRSLLIGYFEGSYSARSVFVLLFRTANIALFQGSGNHDGFGA